MTSTAAHDSGQRAVSVPIGDWIGFLAMCTGMFMAILDIQVVASSLPRIGAALVVGERGLSWIQSAYLIPEIVVIPLTGVLTQALSLRWLCTGSTLIFLLGSLGCGISTNYPELIAFRALQGFSGGALVPVVFTSVFAIFPRRLHSLATIFAGSFAMIAPTLGPILGGYLTETFSWHAIFLINVGPGLLVIVLVAVFVHTGQANLGMLRRVDYGTAILATVFLTSLMLLLKEAPRQAWTGPQIYVLAAISLVSLGVTMQQCLSRRHPFLHLKKFSDRAFAAGALLSFVLGVGLYAATYLMPIFLGYVRGHNPFGIGKVMLVTGIAQLLAAPLSTMIEPRVTPRSLAYFGFGLFGAGLFADAYLTPNADFAALLAPQILRGTAVMLCILPATRYALDGWAVPELSDASALFNLMRNMGGAVGIGLVDTIIRQRTPVHVSHLVERLQAGDRSTAEFVGLPLDSFHGRPLGPIDEITKAIVKPLVERAALTQSINDCWILIGGSFLVPLALLWLMPAGRPVRLPADRASHPTTDPKEPAR